MLRKNLFVLFLIVGFMIGGVANAQINVLVLKTNDWGTGILDEITGITYTVISPADLGSTDLSAYDVLYVPSTFQDGSVTVPSQEALDALNAKKFAVGLFVASGGGVVALSEPIGEGRYEWIPVSVVLGTTGNHAGNIVQITSPLHPVMTGLTDADLSNWGSSYHTFFSETAKLTVLAEGLLQPITLAGNYVAGRIVLTAQDPDFHRTFSGAVKLVQNAIDWAAASWLSVYDSVFKQTGTEGILPTVRDYRDEILMVDPLGAKLVVDLYENCSDDLATVLLRRPGLALRGAALVKKHLSGLEKAVDGGTMVMTPLQLAAVSKLLDDIGKAGSAGLRAYMKQVQASLEDEKALASLGIKVSSRMLRRAPGQRDSLTATWGAIKGSVE